MEYRYSRLALSPPAALSLSNRRERMRSVTTINLFIQVRKLHCGLSRGQHSPRSRFGEQLQTCQPDASLQSSVIEGRIGQWHSKQAIICFLSGFLSCPSMYLDRLESCCQHATASQRKLYSFLYVCFIVRTPTCF